MFTKYIVNIYHIIVYIYGQIIFDYKLILSYGLILYYRLYECFYVFSFSVHNQIFNTQPNTTDMMSLSPGKDYIRHQKHKTNQAALNV